VSSNRVPFQDDITNTVLQKHIRMALKERMVGNQKLGRAWDEESMRKFFKLEFM
jgi:hypothetical protein